MKGTILCLLALGFFFNVIAQKDYVRKPSLGIGVFYYDFQTASAIKTQGLANVLNNHEWSKLGSLKPGIALSYNKGVNAHLDFNLTASAANSILDSSLSSTESLLVELAATANLKLLTDKYFVSPYLTAGAGASVFGAYYGAFIPLGVGLQFNIFDEAYVTLNAQYRVKLTENTRDHFYYGLSIYGSFFGKKPEAPKPLPVPVVEPVKDRDGDGIVDSLDKCPDIFGLASMQGCPDKDGDGISDAEDKCPDVFGVARYLGCPIPDTDGDGINDEEDSCVNVAGTLKYHGCPIPDTDGDGINDEQDKCPTVKGIAKYQGCPIPDRDKDGVNDEEDKCPDQPGPASRNGCPVTDRDNDGVNDDEDRCPDVPGTAANHGCPDVPANVSKTIATAAQNIQFMTGTAKLSTKSNASLNRVVAILNENPSVKLSIEGHTDNAGDDAKNQQLSDDRAAAVKAYFVSKGISEDRITSEGFGETRPIAENTTAAGRAKNRRVEIKVVY